MKRAKQRVAVAALVASIASSGAARAFDSKGHRVIEALAYRTLVEGHGDRPPAPEVLRDLINDGALFAPICYGEAARRTRECRKAAVDNPLLAWPEPLTDRPDAAYRRQFSDPGQCYHFMATLDDEGSAPLEGSSVPRALATTAVVRCRDLLDELLRNVVVRGGAASRESGHGLYELMHSVGDSFSYAHTERTADHKIAFLRTWEPIAKLAGGRFSAEYTMSPTRHTGHDVRDEAYVRNFAEVGGRPCRDRTDYPYDVPFACLSDEGDQAREAIVELLVIVHRLRGIQLAAGSQVDTHPDQSDDWKAYKDKWFSPVTPCRGAECEARQPLERVPSNDFLLGLSGNHNSTRRFSGATIRGMLIKYSWDLNPFVYGVAADVGYRRQQDDGTQYGVAALELDLYLPLGRHAAVGVSPAIFGYAFGTGPHEGPQLLSQALRIDFLAFRNVWLELSGPVQMDWIDAQVELAFGLTLGVAPSKKESASESFVQPRVQREVPHDDTWAPPPLWYGRMKGRVSSWYVVGSTSPEQTPPAAIPGRFYGDALMGAAVVWDRDPWSQRYPTAYGGSLEFGLRNTSSDFRYLTSALSIELRWYPVSILGISLVPARLEAGVQVSGTGVDQARDVQTAAGRGYFLQAGSRIGAALRAGIIDLLVQAPTLSWNNNPWSTAEIATFRVGIRL
jgi:hypothetical protein